MSKRKKSSITIKDVARTAGVSVSTVSRVLNEKDDVAEETIDLVKQTIDDLGYASSLAARSMRSRRNNVLGVIVIDLSDPFSAELVRGISQAIRDTEYDLIIYSSGRTAARTEVGWEREHIARLNGSIVDGMILKTPTTIRLPDNAPLVVVDPFQDDVKFPAVLSTNFEGAMNAVTHLIELGHQRIGYLGGRPDLMSAVRRRKGYEQAMHQAGLPLESNLIETGDYTHNTAYQCAHRLLNQPERPTAIFAANDQSAFGVMDAAKELGLQIPQDLSLIGFDDIFEASRTDPALTTVSQPISDMGLQATELLMSILRGDEVTSQITKVPTHLIIRESCQALP